MFESFPLMGEWPQSKTLIEHDDNESEWRMKSPWSHQVNTYITFFALEALSAELLVGCSRQQISTCMAAGASHPEPQLMFLISRYLSALPPNPDPEVCLPRCISWKQTANMMHTVTPFSALAVLLLVTIRVATDGLSYTPLSPDGSSLCRSSGARRVIDMQQ